MSTGLSRLSLEHLQRVDEYYSSQSRPLGVFGRWYRRNLARRLGYAIPTNASVLEIGCGGGELLAELGNRDVTGVDLSVEQVARATRLIPYGHFFVSAGEAMDLGRTFDIILISDTLNLAADVQALFHQSLRHAHPKTRLIVTFQNHLWRPLVNGAEAIGLKSGAPVNNWLSQSDVSGLLGLSDWQPIHSWQEWLCPVPAFGLEGIFNRWITPFLQPLGLLVITVARPTPAKKENSLTVSVVVPARNEEGNIEAAVERTPEMGRWTELIFVEGNSKDQTWREICRVKEKYPERRIKILQQTGKGKGNAVREGFDQAEGDILMILDADLTVPPEELPKFYEAVASGRAEFANGSRLVYPMEKGAMQFLNMCANKFFGLAFSWLLGQPIKDTLCGTKVLRREDYFTIVHNRSHFGDFDPFGDFDLLFGASKLNLKIADIPIRYRERTYGETNIQRWKHGLLLFRMLWFAARKVKFVR